MRTCQTTRRWPAPSPAASAASLDRPSPASGSGTRRWPWSSRSAATACTCCSGSGPSRRSRDGGRCPAARWEPTSGSGTSAGRHLAAKVDLTDIAYLEQLETRSDPARDPRGRVLATAYLALVPPTSSRASRRTPRGTRSRTLPPTAFDHGSIAESGRDRLRAKLSYTNIGFALAPATFTIAQLRDIYAASLGHPVSATNLQRVLTRRGVIEATAGGRPAHLGGRPARHPLPVRGPDPGRDPPLRRVPPPERAGG